MHVLFDKKFCCSAVCDGDLTACPLQRLLACCPLSHGLCLLAADVATVYLQLQAKHGNAVSREAWSVWRGSHLQGKGGLQGRAGCWVLSVGDVEPCSCPAHLLYGVDYLNCRCRMEMQVESLP